MFFDFFQIIVAIVSILASFFFKRMDYLIGLLAMAVLSFSTSLIAVFYTPEEFIVRNSSTIPLGRFISYIFITNQGRLFYICLFLLLFIVRVLFYIKSKKV